MVCWETGTTAPKNILGFRVLGRGDSHPKCLVRKGSRDIVVGNDDPCMWDIVWFVGKQEPQSQNYFRVQEI